MMSEAIIESTSQSTFRLKVTNITNLKKVFTPIHVVHDIPWQIKVFVNNQLKSNQNNQKSLGISLVCATSDTSQSWSQTASFSFQLIPFDDEVAKAIKRISEPQAFNCNMKTITFPSIVDWCDLMNAEKHLINDDAIQMDINIDAVDPNDNNQSMLIFEQTSKCCENDCLADFKLTVVNIKQLMAVRSPQFLLRGLLWDFTIYKDRSSQLVIQFGLRTKSDKVSCKIRMTTKLNTSKKNITPIGRVDTKILKHSQVLLMQKLMAWDKLLDTQNGFVENDAITLKIEIKIDKPEFVCENDGMKMKATAAAATEKTMQLKMECAICMEAIGNQNLSCPPCGHVFCAECLTNTAQKQKVCPTCSITITEDNLQRIYLPM